jgi:hypothetical protein
MVVFMQGGLSADQNRCSAAMLNSMLVIVSEGLFARNGSTPPREAKRIVDFSRRLDLAVC